MPEGDNPEEQWNGSAADRAHSAWRDTSSAMWHLWNPLKDFMSNTGQILEQGRNRFRDNAFDSGGGTQQVGNFNILQCKWHNWIVFNLPSWLIQD